MLMHLKKYIGITAPFLSGILLGWSSRKLSVDNFIVFKNVINNFWEHAQSNLDFRGVWANFFGGLILIIFLFFWGEFFRPKRNLTGEWEVKNTVVNTAYKPYEGLSVIWKLHMLQSENIISGSGEKIKDIHLDNSEYEYEPAKRDSVELQGYVEKNYFRKSRVFINVIQVGRLRKSRATYILRRVNDTTLVGEFVSTAADISGITIFSRDV